MNARPSSISTSSVRSGIGLLDVDERIAARVEDAEAVVAAHVDARRLHELLVERIDRDAAGGDRLADGAVGEDHRAIIPRHGGQRAESQSGSSRRSRSAARARAPRRRSGSSTPSARSSARRALDDARRPRRGRRARWRARVCALEGLLRRRRPAHDGRRALALGRAAGAHERDDRAAGRGRRRDLARQARDDAAGLGDDGPDAGPADLPEPARPRARPRRLVVGLRRRRRVGHRRPRARHRRRRQRAPPGGGLRRRRLQADLRLGAARRLHAVRAELRHGRRDRAQRRRGGAAVLGDRRHAAAPTSTAGSTGLRVGFLGGYFTAALEDDVAAMLERARARVRAREIDIGWSQTDNRSMGADLHGRARRLRARPRPVAATDAIATTRRRSPTSRQSRTLPGDRVPARPARARRGAAALRGRRRRLRHPALRLRAVRAGPHRRPRQDDAHERAHEALQRARLARARAARRASTATACR